MEYSQFAFESEAIDIVLVKDSGDSIRCSSTYLIRLSFDPLAYITNGKFVVCRKNRAVVDSVRAAAQIRKPRFKLPIR